MHPVKWVSIARGILLLIGLCITFGFLLGVHLLFSYNVNEFEIVNTAPLFHKGPVYKRKYATLATAGDESRGPPPWGMAPINILNDSEMNSYSGARFLLGNYSFAPGLGNIMFQYASLLSLAQHYNATIILPNNILLRRAFRLKRAKFVNQMTYKRYLKGWPKTRYPDCCRYYPESKTKLFTLAGGNSVNSQIGGIESKQETGNLGDRRPSDNSILNQTEKKAEQNQVLALGYFQSFKYFHPSNMDIVRDEFEFLPDIQTISKLAIQNTTRTFGTKLDVNVRIVTVAVHVRHGVDVSWSIRNTEHGHRTAPESYFHDAMKYIRNQYFNSSDTPLFMVFSDDIYWCKRHLKGPDIYYVTTKERESDLCAISLCDHVIMSVGTFSWWGAYLANTKMTSFRNHSSIVIYYSKWPTPNSKLDGMVKKNDFFLDTWIASKDI